MGPYLPASSGVLISNSSKFSCFSSISCRMALMVWCYQIKTLKTSLQEGRYFSLIYNCQMHSRSAKESAAKIKCSFHFMFEMYSCFV